MSLGEQKCTALPFFHAFTGCDISSSFFNQGKCKFWDRWIEFNEENVLTEAFSLLSRKPESVTLEQCDVIERYLAFVYFEDVSDSIDALRHREFEHATHNNL